MQRVSGQRQDVFISTAYNASPQVHDTWQHCKETGLTLTFDGHCACLAALAVKSYCLIELS